MIKSRNGSPLKISRLRQEVLHTDHNEYSGRYSDRYDVDRPLSVLKSFERSENKTRTVDYGSILNSKEKEINQLTRVVRVLYIKKRFAKRFVFR